MTLNEPKDLNLVGRPHDGAKPRVLLVGAFPQNPNDDVRGGQLSLCSTLINSPLALEFDLVTLDTTQKAIPPPPLPTRLSAALRRLLRYNRILSRGTLDAVLVMSSSRASCVEKGVMVWWGRYKRVGTGFYLVSTRLFNDAQSNHLWRWWLRRLIAWSDVLVCQGRTMAERYEELAGSTRPCCVVIPSPLDLSEWEPEDGHKRVRKSQPTTVLFSGSIHRDKGVFDLVEAIEGSELLRQQQIVLCGAGAHLEDLSVRLWELKLNDTVSLEGWVNHKELKQWFSDAQIFVLPSHSEGLPMSLIEALVSEKAVVTTSVGVVPDYVENGEHALLVPPRDPVSLRHALERLVGDPQLRLRLARNGGRMARETFDARPAYRAFADNFYHLRDITTSRRVPSLRR